MEDLKLHNFKDLYGLIGYPLSHSFSKKYFAEKFERERVYGCYYELFPLRTIERLPLLLETYPNLSGLNVTIPYKQAVLSYLDDLDEEAEAIGAVNTIQVTNGRLKGYNTDVFGFEKSLELFLADNKNARIKALILGVGGAASAVVYVLKKMKIPCLLVSRTPGKGDLIYEDIDRDLLQEHHLIVNTTPLGMEPNIESFPNISYHYLSDQHFLYDLVYNPLATTFMKKGSERGANVKNGLEMLELQAEKAWKIWRNSTN